VNQLPFTVTTTSPSGNGLVITPSSPISATFNQTFSQSTVTTRTFTVRGSQTGVYTGTYVSSDASVQFTNTHNFKPGEEIVVNLSRGLKAATDKGFLTPYAWQFRAAVAGGVGFFSDSGQSLGSSYSNAVALGDLDNDGDLDALVASYYDYTTLWLNDGLGNFSDSGQSLSNTYTYVIVLGDLDNDGDLDAFFGNDGPSTVWLNDGSGNFSDSGQSLGNSATYAVALGDLDGDGDLDAFGGDGDGNRVWLNDGVGAFSEGDQSLGSAENYAVTLGDLDSDGDLDALVGNSEGNRVWLNDGLVQSASTDGMNPDVDEAINAEGSAQRSISDSVACLRSSRSGTLSTTKSVPAQASPIDAQIVSEPTDSGGGSRSSSRHARKALSCTSASTRSATGAGS
jgi:hypothetical protein